MPKQISHVTKNYIELRNTMEINLFIQNDFKGFLIINKKYHNNYGDELGKWELPFVSSIRSGFVGLSDVILQCWFHGLLRGA